MKNHGQYLLSGHIPLQNDNIVMVTATFKLINQKCFSVNQLLFLCAIYQASATFCPSWEDQQVNVSDWKALTLV